MERGPVAGPGRSAELPNASEILDRTPKFRNSERVVHKILKRAAMIKKANEETVSAARTGFLTLGKVKRSDAVDNAAFMDLASHLRFSPKNGRIWLDNRRMLLVDSYAMGALRMELIESLGPAGTAVLNADDRRVAALAQLLSLIHI